MAFQLELQPALGLEEGGHGFVIPSHAVKDAAQFIRGARAQIWPGIEREVAEPPFGFLKPSRLPVQPGAHEQGRAVRGVRLQDAVNQVEGGFRTAQPFINFRQFDDGGRGGVFLLQGAFEITLGHGKVIETTAEPAGGRERFRFIGSHPHGLFKAAFGGGLIKAQPVQAAQLEQNGGVGGVQPAGAFHHFDGRREIAAFPRLAGRLENARQGAFGNQG